ncbi:hypothetical protein LB505_003762 [Fusarium chuoi]|nr:hypothetical protein LB505_003762 [Fusarium chuoi]
MSLITDIVLYKVRVIRLACSTLEKMQSLRRFAFGFDKSRLKPDAIPEILEQTPRDFNEKLGDEFDTGTVANCLLLSFLATQVSTLEEICMTTEYPEFYRITRKDGEFDIGRDSFDDPSQKDLFPSVLMG